MHLKLPLDPNSSFYICQLIDSGLSELKRNNLADAWKLINRAGQLKSSAEILFLKGYTLEKMGDFFEAIFFYDQALKKQPDYKKALYAYLLLATHLKTNTTTIKKYRAEELLVKSQWKDKKSFELASGILLDSASSQYIGGVWKEKNELIGWAVNTSDKLREVEIRYELKGKIVSLAATQKSKQLFDFGMGNGCNAFSIPITDNLSNSLFYFPCGNLIPGSPIKVSKTHSKNNYEEIQPNLNKNRPVKSISIIIPVYKDIKSLKKCIDSIFDSRNKLTYHIILVNDASPEPEIITFLNNLKQNSLVTVLTNSLNLGFVKSVNKGINFARFSDCILLNSDTEVNHHWLDRLHEAAYSNHKIATVTPMSNNSELTSYPIIHYENSLPSGYPWQYLDEIAAKVNRKKYIEIPSGVGFCFFIKRQCINECGGFNETDILKGYGDEAEFCSRISKHGWKNICATNVFVAHEGGKSFNHEKRKLALENMKYLEKLYPEYKENYLNFIRKDPLLSYRYNIEKTQLAKNPNCQKLVLLDFDEIIQEHEIFEAIKNNASIFWIKPEYHRNKLVYRLGRDKERTPANFVYRLPEEKKRLIGDLREINVPHVEYREINHYLQFLIDIPRQLNCSYSIYPSDFALICPRIYLIKEDGNLCSGPKNNDCESCLKQFGGLMYSSPLKQENKSGKERLKSYVSASQQINQFIENSEQIRVDSQLSFEIFKQSVSSTKIVKNNNKFLTKRPNIAIKEKKIKNTVPLKLAITHGIGAYSGYSLLLELAKYANLNNIDIEFLVFGNTINDFELQKTGKVFISDTLKQDEYRLLIERYNCDTCLFLYQWPIPLTNELYLCRKNRLKIAAFDMGICAELFKQDRQFLLLPPNANIEGLCKYLLDWRLNEPKCFN